jgi:hypothetical protein
MTTEQSEPTSQERFAEIVERVAKKETLSSDDIEFLITLVSSFDVHLRVANEMLSAALGTTQEMLIATANDILRRVGRTDQKIRRKMAAVCEENFQALMNVVQLHGQTIQNKLLNQQEDENANQDNSTTDSN